MGETDIGGMLTDTATKVLAAHCAAGQRQAETEWDGALWQELENAGLTYALEPDGNGPMEIPIGDALQLARLAGQFSAPVPLTETMLASWLAQRAGLEVPPGPLSVAPTHHKDAISLEKSGSSWRISGTASRVPWGRNATAVAVCAGPPEHPLIAIVPAQAFKIQHSENLAGEPRDKLSFDGDLTAGSVAAFDGSAEELYLMGATMRVLQISGALDEILSLSVKYVSERIQFGAPISKFQIIQHSIAVLGSQAAAARAAAESAAQIAACGGSPFGVAAAKIRAGEAAGLAARLAHQVHGAMGFTQDYPLQLSTRRLWSWRDEFGNETEWSLKLGREVCREGAQELWPFITERMS